MQAGCAEVERHAKDTGQVRRHVCRKIGREEEMVVETEERRERRREREREREEHKLYREGEKGHQCVCVC